MEKIIFNNETYYLNKGVVYDSSFIEAPKCIANEVLANFYSKVDLSILAEQPMIDHVKQLKTAERYQDCLKAVWYGLQKFSTSVYFYRTVFPIITSCYRALNQPQKAIDFWMAHKQLFSSCLSPALLTSLAAAYCDVGNYEMAKKCANKAYAIQGGSQNYTTELSLVYKRIKKETKDDTLL